jgi:eukaryotic-like serine/threonine-protein kinase
MRRVRLFVSSPIDVAFERQRLQRVVERLNGEYAQVVRFETVRWETRFYSAHTSIQAKIPEAKDCDIVVAVFWSRLGSMLPESFATMPPELALGHGERYPSGSAYEVLSSIHQRRVNEAGGGAQQPDVFVFRKNEPPLVALKPGEIAEAQSQWESLEAFFKRFFRAEDGTVLLAYHLFGTSDEFERRAEALLRGWIKENIAGAAAIVWPIGTLGSPFRGLAAFDGKHASVFFGRDRKVSRAIELLKDAGEAAESAVALADAGPGDRKARPFLLVVGPSGAGKSSLMRAGIAPRLTASGVVPSVDVWRTAVLRPGDGASPFDALANALLLDERGDESGFDAALPELAQFLPQGSPHASSLARVLEAGGQAAVDTVLDALERAAEPVRVRDGYERALRCNLLLLVDQLEDIFGANLTDDTRARFAHLLADLAASKRIWIVATLRGDLYDRLITDRPWIALKDSGVTYDLAPPGLDELEEIVRRSAAAAGLTYELDAATGRPLDQLLLDDADAPDILPLLQFTLDRLFDERTVVGNETRLTVAAYQAMGGLDGAINEAAERALKRVGSREIDALPRLLRRLAVPVDSEPTSGGGSLSMTVRAAPIAEVRTSPEIERLVDVLVDSRVLLTSKAVGGGLLRVAHQRVFESWQRARSIIAQQRDFFRIRDDVEQQHRRWVDGGEKSQLLIPAGVAIAEAEQVARNYKSELTPALQAFIAKSGRRARWRLRALRGATLVFAALAGIAGWQWRVATLAEQAADAANKEAVASYGAAKSTIQQLIESFTGRLSRMQGVTVDTVETAFTEISHAVDKLGEQAAKSDPSFAATRAELALAFARTYKKAEAARAAEIAEGGLGLLKELAERFPANLDYQWSILEAQQLISDLKRSTDPEAARSAVADARRIGRALVKADPNNASWAEGLSQSLVRSGDLEQQLKNFKAALQDYEEALDLGLAWHLKEPQNMRRYRELSWLLNKIGSDQMRGSGSAAAALDLFEDELCLRRRLFEADSSDTRLQADVSWSLDRVSGAQAKLGDIPGAELALIEAIGLREGLRSRDPKDIDWLRDLEVIFARYGHLKLVGGKPDVALAYLDEAAQLHKELSERNGLQNWMPAFEGDIAKAEAIIGKERSLEVEGSKAAIRANEEGERARSILLRRPRSDACWARTTASLNSLNAERTKARQEKARESAK